MAPFFDPKAGFVTVRLGPFFKECGVRWRQRAARCFFNVEVPCYGHRCSQWRRASFCTAELDSAKVRFFPGRLNFFTPDSSSVGFQPCKHRNHGADFLLCTKLCIESLNWKDLAVSWIRPVSCPIGFEPAVIKIVSCRALLIIIV